MLWVEIFDTEKRKFQILASPFLTKGVSSLAVEFGYKKRPQLYKFNQCAQVSFTCKIYSLSNNLGKAKMLEGNVISYIAIILIH